MNKMKTMVVTYRGGYPTPRVPILMQIFHVLCWLRKPDLGQETETSTQTIAANQNFGTFCTINNSKKRELTFE